MKSSSQLWKLQGTQACATEPWGTGCENGPSESPPGATVPRQPRGVRKLVAGRGERACAICASTNGGNIRWEARPPDCYSSAPGSDAPLLAPDRPRHPQVCLILSQGDHGPVPSPSNKLLLPSGPPGSVLSLSCWWEKRTVLSTSQCPFSCPAASASTWTTWSPRNLISSQPQSPVPQTGEASRAPPAK
jgi:hypothetical protein